MTDQLFPKPPRKMKKPRKAELYARLDSYSARFEIYSGLIEQLTAEIERLRTPWWRKLWRKVA